jgi:hypothetical protein
MALADDDDVRTNEQICRQVADVPSLGNGLTRSNIL